MSERPGRPRVPWPRHLATALGDYPRAIRWRLAGLRAGLPPEPPEPPEQPEPRGARGARPVVIIPGVYETWRFLRPIVLRMVAAGHPVHAVPAMGVNRAPIPQAARHVAAELERLELRDAALVAHSKGGLVGKHVMAFLDPERRVDRMVAIATPFGGSRLARGMPGRAMREFRPDNPVIRALDDELAVNERIVSIFPRFDPHIPEGSALPGARNIELAVVGHFRVLRDPATADEVLRALADDPAAADPAPGPADDPAPGPADDPAPSQARDAAGDEAPGLA